MGYELDNLLSTPELLTPGAKPLAPVDYCGRLPLVAGWLFQNYSGHEFANTDYDATFVATTEGVRYGNETILFNGVSSIVNCGTLSGIYSQMSSGSVTIVAVITAGVVANERIIINDADAGYVNHSMDLRITSAGAFQFFVYDGVTINLATGGLAVAGERAVVIATYDLATKMQSVYVDGNLMASVLYTGGIPSPGVDATIGRFGAAATGYFNGGTEAVFLLDGALSPSECEDIGRDVYSLVKPTSAGVWVPTLVGSTTPVNNDTTLQWDVIAQVLVDSTLQWDVLNSIHNDSALQWDILNVVLNDADLRWDLVQIVQADNTIKWDVNASVQADSTLQWDLIQAIFSDSALTWDVLNLVINDVGLQWDIVSEVNQNIDLRWDALNSISNDSTIEWDLTNSIFQSMQAQWDVLNPLQIDVSLLWDVSAAVAHDLSLKWMVSTTTTSDLSIMWDSLSVAGNTVQFKWNVNLAGITTDKYLRIVAREPRMFDVPREPRMFVVAA